MPKKMLIDATHAEETRVVVVEGNKVEDFDFESLKKRQLAGNIYLAKVIRVEPSLQAAFVDYGGNRHGFLAFSEIHPDYYQIPAADRAKLIAEEEAYAKAMAEDDNQDKPKSRRRRRPSKSKASAEGTPKDETVLSHDVIDVEDSDSGLVDVPETPDQELSAPAPEKPTSPEPEAEAAEEPTNDAPARDDAVAEAAPVEEPDPADDFPPEVDENDLADLRMLDGAPNEFEAPTPDTNTAAANPPKEGIESVADDDVEDEVRPRKPRPRRYKIQEVIKVRQIMLVQVVKEERGNKGAALTTYLSLAGRYCVLMPNTARGGGISRKITNATDRKKLKAIAGEIEVPKGAGLIIRTAGAKRNKTDIKRDYEYLQRQWEQVRELTLKSIAPTQIYAEGDLIKRSIRDLYNREIDEILVEGENGYKIAKDYMTMLMPSRVDRVKLYHDPMPLFARYQVEGYLSGMFNPVVQLKSGGYLVIGVTEALVAIDVNSGKATKEASIEETALKTNLEAAEEVARQLRLRDLAGLIVIDFIDMEERRNNTAVERRIKDKLKDDRARIQVGKISGFGLMEMSRQRLRPGMIEATTAPCPSCHGTGIVRSDDNQSLAILRELEEEGVRQRSKEVLVKAPVNIANYLLNAKREHVAAIEQRYNMSVRIEADTALISPDYSFELFKTATRIVTAPVDALQAVTIESAEIGAQPEQGEEQPRKRRRRRRRRGGRNRDAETAAVEATDQEQGTEQLETSEEEPTPEAAAEHTEAAPAEVAAEPGEETPKPAKAEKPKRKRAPRKRKAETKAEEPAEATAEDSTGDEAAPVEEKPKRKRAPRKKKAEAKAPETIEEPVSDDTGATPEEVEEPQAVEPTKEAEAEPVTPVEEPSEAPEQSAEPETASAGEEAPAAPKRSGWWSR